MTPLRGPVAEEALRFAARVVAGPAHAVGRWRAVTGGKAVGCLSMMPVPEILHAAGLLPVPLTCAEIPPSLRSRLDAWIFDPDSPAFPETGSGKPRFELPGTPAPDLANVLDLLESLAEWSACLSGRAVTEGNLWKSIRAYGERNRLLRLLKGREPPVGGFPREGDIDVLARAGDFLPPESHSLLLARGLRIAIPEISASPEGERGDPFLLLSLRLIHVTQ